MDVVLKNFDENGYAVIEDLLTLNEIDSLIKECDSIVCRMDVSEQKTIFETGDKQVADNYFLNSSDKISFFFEKESLDSKGELIVEKSRSLNKIGHALHWWNPVFKKMTFSDKIKNILKQLEYKDPGLVQSMCIFKHPEIGGIVTPHQDSTYLYTTPLSTIGFWIPLVDVTRDNGCLHFLPGSHKGPVHQRFVRNPTGDPLLKHRGEVPTDKDDTYIPVTAKRGDCVLIHGSVLHKSGKNRTNISRLVYTFHVIEKEDTAYSSENWLQPSETLVFPSVYEVQS